MAGRWPPLRDWEGPLPPELEPLTTKPVVPVVNGPDGIDLKLEAELAELPEEEAAAFRDGESALDEVVHRLFEVLGLITFFTAGETEARGWTLSRGQTALEAAGSIHTDIARGFIRCEVVRWSDLVETGSYAEAARRGCSGSRARPTRCRTATCSPSASTSSSSRSRNRSSRSHMRAWPTSFRVRG